MKYDRSLEEVWEWKDQVYQKTKGLTMDQTVEKIRKGAEELCKKYNLQLKKASPKTIGA